MLLNQRKGVLAQGQSQRGRCLIVDLAHEVVGPIIAAEPVSDVLWAPTRRLRLNRFFVENDRIIINKATASNNVLSVLLFAPDFSISRKYVLLALRLFELCLVILFKVKSELSVCFKQILV